MNADEKAMFDKYGRIKFSSVKVGFAFIEFEDLRDAEDAVVEVSRGASDDAGEVAMQALARGLVRP